MQLLDDIEQNIVSLSSTCSSQFNQLPMAKPDENSLSDKFDKTNRIGKR